MDLLTLALLACFPPKAVTYSQWPRVNTYSDLSETTGYKSVVKERRLLMLMAVFWFHGAAR